MAFYGGVEEYICVICREILINPVTLSCKHTSCQNCLEKTLESNKYQCFLCRKFIGSWYRNAKRKNQLINTVLWEEIKDKFADLVKKKLNGESTDLLPFVHARKLSSPGEIKREYELFLEKMKHEFEVEKEKEDKLSEEFIKQLKEKETQLIKKQKEILKFDEKVAKELASELNFELPSSEEQLYQLISDEQLARKLTSDGGISINKSRILSSKTLKNRKRSFAQNPKVIGPMDRFLEGNIKKKIKENDFMLM